VNSIFDSGRRLQEIVKEDDDRRIGWERAEVRKLKLRSQGLAPFYWVEIQNKPTLGFNQRRVDRKLRISLDTSDWPDNPDKGFTFYDLDGNLFGKERGWRPETIVRKEGPTIIDLILLEASPSQ
jgi:hypothetical protein